MLKITLPGPSTDKSAAGETALLALVPQQKPEEVENALEENVELEADVVPSA